MNIIKWVFFTENRKKKHPRQTVSMRNFEKFLESVGITRAIKDRDCKIPARLLPGLFG